MTLMMRRVRGQGRDKTDPKMAKPLITSVEKKLKFKCDLFAAGTRCPDKSPSFTPGYP